MKNVLSIYMHMIANVVVLIPPPVLPGEAPTNISNIIIVILAELIAPISMVLYPSVVDADIT